MAANRWVYLVLLSFLRVAMGMQFQSVGAAGPAIRDELELDYAALGALAGPISCWAPPSRCPLAG